MQTVPLELPVSAAEAGELAELVLDQLDRGRLTHESRSRFAQRVDALRLGSFKIYPGSIARDPIHPSTYYLAADARDGSILLRVAPASSPASGLFPKAMLIGRIRIPSGHEVVINAAPFGPSDRDHLRCFSEQVESSFLPRPHGSLPAITVQSRNPAATMPDAFQAFRSVLERTGINVAAVEIQGDYEDSYYATLWAAIRSGWREGYTVVAEIDRSTDVSAVARYTKFTVREHTCSIDEAERLYDSIVEVKAGHGGWRKFDFEVSAEWVAKFKEGGRHVQASGTEAPISLDGLDRETIENRIVARAEALRS